MNINSTTVGCGNKVYPRIKHVPHCSYVSAFSNTFDQHSKRIGIYRSTCSIYLAVLHTEAVSFAAFAKPLSRG